MAKELRKKMNKKLIIIITENGEKTVDIKFEWKPTLKMKPEEEHKNSQVLLECFDRISKALVGEKEK